MELHRQIYNVCETHWHMILSSFFFIFHSLLFIINVLATWFYAHFTDVAAPHVEYGGIFYVSDSNRHYRGNVLLSSAYYSESQKGISFIF